jgi:hypothetical protein
MSTAKRRSREDAHQRPARHDAVSPGLDHEKLTYCTAVAPIRLTSSRQRSQRHRGVVRGPWAGFNLPEKGNSNKIRMSKNPAEIAKATVSSFWRFEFP